jgi:hypothetical protein
VATTRIVGEVLLCISGSDDFHRAGFGVDRLDAALHIDDVDGLEHLQQRCGEGFRIRFVEPRANHQRRLRPHQRDFEFFGRNALDIAQAGCGKCGVHAGEAGAYDDESHIIHSVRLCFSKGSFKWPRVTVAALDEGRSRW